MARRRLFPALRTAVMPAAPGSQAQTEGKAVSIGYASHTIVNAYGHEDRAAGWDMETVIVEGYERCVWVYRCVETIGGHATRPFRIGRNLGKEDEEVLDDHPLYRLLNRQANPLEKGRAFRKRLSAHVLLSKRGAFVEVTRSRLGTPTRLDLLPPERVIPVPDPHGDYLSHFEFTRRDGQMREIDPERIRWIREPHPTDPFCASTPLDAAGLSVRLDHLARQYNVRFIENDARPGTVIGVDTDGIDERELDRIERRFAPGVQHAGRVAVIGTGPGGLKFVDLSTVPRDMAYDLASRNAKLEVLAAFGMPESVLGNAAERTYSNADQEEYNYWTFRQVPFNELIADAFTPDIGDEGWEPYLDTSDVEALELPRRKAREEALKEFQQGLRSIDEYRPLAGLDRVHTPQTRALWVSPAKAPIPTSPEDAAALGADLGGEAPPDGEQAPAIEGGGGTAAEAVQEALDAGRGGGAAATAVQEALAAGQDVSAPGDAAAAVQEALAAGGASQPGEAAAAVQEALQAKAADPASAASAVSYDGGEAETQRAELAVAAALDAMLARQAAVVTARLRSPKTRRGTRFWRPDGSTDLRSGDGPLDAARVVDVDRWAGEVTQTLAPIVQETATDAATGLYTAFTEGGAGVAGAARGVAAEVGLLALTLASEAMRGWLAKVEQRITSAAVTAAGIDDVAAAVEQGYREHARPFAEGVAALVGQVAVVGARDTAARSLLPSPPVAGDVGIVRSWVTQADARVRDSHRQVAGETRPVGERFVVGGAMVRWPGDPFAPADVARNCRCRLVYQATPGARFTPPQPP